MKTYIKGIVPHQEGMGIDSKVYSVFNRKTKLVNGRLKVLTSGRYKDYWWTALVGTTTEEEMSLWHHDKQGTIIMLQEHNVFQDETGYYIEA